MDPNWAKCLKSGQNFSRSGHWAKQNLFILATCNHIETIITNAMVHLKSPDPPVGIGCGPASSHSYCQIFPGVGALHNLLGSLGSNSRVCDLHCIVGHRATGVNTAKLKTVFRTHPIMLTHCHSGP